MPLELGEAAQPDVAAGGEPAHRLGGWRALVDELVGIGGVVLQELLDASGVTAPTCAPSLRESVSPSLWLVTSNWGGVVSTRRIRASGSRAAQTSASR